jgi:hypothetical protein
VTPLHEAIGRHGGVPLGSSVITSVLIRLPERPPYPVFTRLLYSSASRYHPGANLVAGVRSGRNTPTHSSRQQSPTLPDGPVSRRGVASTKRGICSGRT